MICFCPLNDLFPIDSNRLGQRGRSTGAARGARPGALSHLTRVLPPARAPPLRAGRLYQVEYAIAAIQNAAAAIGIQTREGVVVASEKKVATKLLAPAKSSEKIYKVSEHVLAAVAGHSADANILITYARLVAARYEFTYSEPQPVEALVQLLCDYKHGYTQTGGLRPFGVSFLYAGWDRHFGFQLYQSDPSGTYRCAGAPALCSAACAARAFSTFMTPPPSPFSAAGRRRLSAQTARRRWRR